MIEINEWSDNALRVFTMRYCQKGFDGEPIEPPDEAIERVADNVAIVSALYAPAAWGEWDSGDVDAARAALDPDVFPYRTARRRYEQMADEFDPGTSDTGPKLPPPMEVVLHRGMGDYRSQRERYLDYLRPLAFLPNSPTWTGAGTPLGQLAACFVLPIDDALVNTDRDSIMGTLRDAVAIQQTGGGNGFDFSSLRPDGSIVNKSMGQASGPVGFMRMYDGAFGVIHQGGIRRGANMAILRVDHPDILKFIEAKTPEGALASLGLGEILDGLSSTVRAKLAEGVLANFNISVAVTEAFMHAVFEHREFDLVFDGKVYDTVDAYDLYTKILESTWTQGDPGNVFIDAMNDDNPCPDHYTIVATNPCAEQPLPPYGNCTLGSIALPAFVTQDGVNWVGLAEAIVIGVEFLDDVVDANGYVESVPRLAEMATNERRIGLDYLGLADALFTLGIRYGSEEAQEFGSLVTEFFRYYALQASLHRARSRGPFPWCPGSRYDEKAPRATEWHSNLPIRESYANLWERPSLNWQTLIANVGEYGVRNATQLNFAPNGTRTTVALRTGLEGSGMEPAFALAYRRWVTQGEERIPLDYLSPAFDRQLTAYGVADFAKERILDAVKATGGSCQIDMRKDRVPGLDEIPTAVRDAFVVAADVPPLEHVAMQAALQRWTDQAISKTINFPFDATVDDVRKAYEQAFISGCKGITVYRQGSREMEVLQTVAKAVVEAEGSIEWPLLDPLAMPAWVGEHGLPGRVFPVRTPFGTVQVTMTELLGEEGRPFDLRLSVGKAGSDKGADVEALGRMISLCLRSGVKVEHVVEQLADIGGRTVEGFGASRVLSVPDAVARLLRREYLGEEQDETLSASFAITDAPLPVGALERIKDRVCPDCGNASLIMSSGCAHCEPALGGCGLYTGCD